MAENGINGTAGEVNSSESLQNGHDTALQNGDTLQNGESPKNGESPENGEIPQKVIYKNEEKGNPSLNLGVWGKIPIHTLNEMYIDTADGGMLTLCEAKRSRSIGGWVYDGAACQAKYLESLHYTTPSPEGGCMAGKRVIELGAGTGVVGLMAGYHGADAVITDMDNIVPLIQHNIEQNRAVLKGRVTAQGLVWGEDAGELAETPVDYLILANCVYYDPSLELLAWTVRQLASTDTEVLVCYEERTMGIKAIINRWHDLIKDDFSIEYLPNAIICEEFKQDFVRLVRMKRLQ